MATHASEGIGPGNAGRARGLAAVGLRRGDGVLRGAGRVDQPAGAVVVAGGAPRLRIRAGRRAGRWRAAVFRRPAPCGGAAGAVRAPAGDRENGRGAGRESGCTYVWISGVAVSNKKNN